MSFSKRQIARRIAIIGTGRIGTRLAEQLAFDRVCDEIFLWNRSYNKLEGVLLSLNKLMELARVNIKISKLDFRKLNDIDLIVIAIKESYDPRTLGDDGHMGAWLPREDLKYVGLKYDLPQVQQVCRKLKDYKNAILVISNPVDLIASVIQKTVQSARVYGSGVSLDAARLAIRLSSKTDIQLKGKDVLLAGEHGTNLIPVKSHWSKELANVPDGLISNCLRESRETRERIVRFLGYTLHDCAHVFFKDIEWLLNTSKEDKCNAFSIWRNRACIGWPVIRDSNTGSIEPIESLNEQEIHAITTAEDRIVFLWDMARKEEWI